jgi:hypothetical protein
MARQMRIKSQPGGFKNLAKQTEALSWSKASHQEWGDRVRV